TQKYVLYFCSHCARYMPALAPETFGFRGAASCRANRKSTSCTFALTARGTCPRLLRKPSVSAARHPAALTAKVRPVLLLSLRAVHARACSGNLRFPRRGILPHQLQKRLVRICLNGRPGGNRTPNLRFWRPPLCQLSYW